MSPDANPDASTDASESPGAGADASADASGAVAREELPNARIRLRLHFLAPALPERTIEQTIWLSGSRFRVRDEAGRAVSEILGDVTYPRGLGVPATTMEEMMDRRDAARKKPPGVTDLYGDLATDAGVVARWSDKPWPKSARELALVARQVLSGDRTSSLARSGEVTRLGRAATEYRGTVEVVERGATQKNAIVRVTAPPYLLLDDVRDAASPNHFYVREVVALDEGVVTDADVTPPSPAP